MRRVPPRSWGKPDYATFWTLLERMQDVQTRMRFPAPLIRARTDWRLMFQRRLVTLCAWLIRLPNLGPRPQISQICAIKQESPVGVKNDYSRVGGDDGKLRYTL